MREEKARRRVESRISFCLMTNLDSILKSRDITFPTKVCLVKAMVFPAVMYECESWTIKKAESESEKSLSRIRLFAAPWSIQARILEWVAFPFSRGSSQLRDQTRVSCIAGGSFTS